MISQKYAASNCTELDRSFRAGNHLQHNRYQEVEPEDHQQQRDRAHQVDVAGRQHRERFESRQARHGKQGAENRAADSSNHGQLQRILQTGHQVGPGAGYDIKIEITHYLPPAI
jgi:hypothetical protein